MSAPHEAGAAAPVQDGGPAEVARLYEQGRYLAAYRLADRGGLLRAGRGAEPSAALLAARIIRQAGGRRRARRRVFETWRAHRAHPQACVQCAFELTSEGPLCALAFMERVGDLQEAPPDERSSWLAARALQLAALRDFEAAEQAWTSADQLGAGDPWVWCVRAMIEDHRDRPEQALPAIARARALSAWYRPAVELEARLLDRLRRRTAARDLLEEAAGRLESFSVLLALQSACLEQGDLDRALECLLAVVRLTPCMELPLHDHPAGRFAYLLYRRGDRARAIAVGRLSRSEGARRALDRLERAPDRSERRLLPVPQIRQHHRTCAPATLTSIAEFWGEPVEHLELAEEICHDGTPAVSERRWAVERGFAVREFTVTWEAATALIDRGVPFALTTVGTGSSHQQAVAGYDRALGTLLVRNPSSLALEEYDWESLRADQAAFGPRGLVLAPPSMRPALDALALPDAELFDRHFAVEDALRRHDRAAAQAAHDELCRVAPDHRLRHQARRALASYDGDRRGILEWLDAMLVASPADPRLLLGKLAFLDGLDSRAARLAIAGQLLDSCRGDPAVLAECAQLYAETGDGAERARALAGRAVRAAPSPGALRTLAALMRGGERRAAARLLRFASCLADTDEAAAWSYFTAASACGSAEQALAHLRARVEAMSSRSAQPAQTLCEAYAALGRAAEAFAILDRALAEHPDDGALLLVAAEQHRLAGRLDRAQELLEGARGRSNARAWRRVAAALAAHRGDTDAAFELLRQIVAGDPLDAASQEAYVQQLVRGGGPEQALGHLAAVCERFPFHVPLHQLRCAILSRHAPAEVAPLLDAFLERHPDSDWALRALAMRTAAAGQVAAAHALLDRAAGAARAGLTCARAALARLEGARARARDLYRAAVAIDVDEEGAILGLVELAGGARQAAEELDFAAAEIERQGSRGPGAAAWAEASLHWLDRKTAVERLRALRRREPHLWHTWWAELRALLQAGELHAAAELGRECVQRFELAPPAWLALAQVHAQRGRHDERVAALERAVELDPHWLHGWRTLGEALEAAGMPERARAALERALAIDPLSAVNHGYLADLSRSEGDLEAALAHLRRALRLDPEYVWGWQRMVAWSPAEEVVELARAAIERAPAAVRPRIELAEVDVEAPLERRVELLDQAIGLAPDEVAASDAKARILAEAGRWDEALAACRPPFWGDEPPVVLRGRAAWIRHLRGDGRAAWKDMLAAIAASPDYAWGIEQLARWAQAEGKTAYLETARRIAAAAPDSAPAQAHLGEAHRRFGRLARAEPCFRSALAVEPSLPLARAGLFEIHLARQEYDRARAFLGELDDADAGALALRIRLEVASGRTGEADELFGRLVGLDGASSGEAAPALDAYREAGLSAHVGRLTERLASGGGASRLAGWAWWNGAALGRSRRWRWRRILAMPDSPARDWCAARHIEDYGERGHQLRFLLFFARHRAWMRARTDPWGAAGYCLFELDMPKAACRWMADYRERGGVEPWMLMNLVRALAELDRVDEAWRACRHACALPPDHTSSRHHLLAAVPCAIDGDLAEARAALARGRLGPRDREAEFLAVLAEAVIAFCRPDQPIASRRAAFAWAAERLALGVRQGIVALLGRRHYVTTLTRLRDTDHPDAAGEWRKLLRGAFW